MRIASTAVVLALGAALAVPAAEAAPKKGSSCVTKYGRGWAFTESGARFQAWEIIAQTTGNWPFQTDTFKNERYKCKPEGSQIRCDAKIDVCKS
jgi:hypothetical protein